MSYKGRVYDGPYEGEMLASPNPWYNIAMYPSILPTYREKDAVPEMVDIQRGQYRWSRPLRAWVFVWPTAQVFPYLRRSA